MCLASGLFLNAIDDISGHKLIRARDLAKHKVNMQLDRGHDAKPEPPVVHQQNLLMELL